MGGEAEGQSMAASSLLSMVVPPGVTIAHVVARGGDGSSCIGCGAVGIGANVIANVPVTPGETLYYQEGQTPGPTGALAGVAAFVSSCQQAGPCSAPGSTPGQAFLNSLLVVGGAGGGPSDPGAGGDAVGSASQQITAAAGTWETGSPGQGLMASEGTESTGGGASSGGSGGVTSSTGGPSGDTVLRAAQSGAAGMSLYSTVPEGANGYPGWNGGYGGAGEWVCYHSCGTAAQRYAYGDEGGYGGGGYWGGGGGIGAPAEGGDPPPDLYAPGGGGGDGGSSFVVAGSTGVSITSGTSQQEPGVQITFPTPLVVNSTGDVPDPAASLSAAACNTTPSASAPTCTLPAAIQVANQQGGGTIQFDVPAGNGNTFDGGVPQIDVNSSLLPTLTSPIVVDGTSQPGVGQVEVSGTTDATAVTEGLVVGTGASGSEVMGLVINGFQEMIDLKGADCRVVRDLLGTDVAGTAADPSPLGAPPGLPLAQVAIRVESSGNRLGAPGAGNVIASGYTPLGANGLTDGYGLTGAGEIDDTAGANVIQANSIGVASGTGAPLLGTPAQRNAAFSAVEEALTASGAAETVGGPDEGDGNVIAGGAVLDGTGSIAQGNTFTDGGLEDAARAAGGGGSMGVLLAVGGRETVGGPSATEGVGDGNTFSVVSAAPTAGELAVGGTGTVVQGNKLSGDRDGGIQITGTGVTIGGTSAEGVGNLIEDEAQHGTGPAAGIVVAGTRSAHLLIEHNDFEGNGANGAVNVADGDGVTITQNVMVKNAEGTSLDSQYLEDGEFRPALADANDFQPYPLVFTARERGRQTKMTGRLTEPATFAGDAFVVELYAMKTCSGNAAQGAASLGTTVVRTLLGSYDIALDFAAAPPGDSGVTATATGPDGSTSEFGPCLTLGTTAPSFAELGVTSPSKTIPVSTAPAGSSDGLQRAHGARSRPPAARRTRARGTVTLRCPPVTTGTCHGTVTLRTAGRHPARIAAVRFTLAAGLTATRSFTVPRTLLLTLEHRHRERATGTIAARDGARHPRHKTTIAHYTLIYRR
jgi:hypothetical protein